MRISQQLLKGEYDNVYKLIAQYMKLYLKRYHHFVTFKIIGTIECHPRSVEQKNEKKCQVTCKYFFFFF